MEEVTFEEMQALRAERKMAASVKISDEIPPRATRDVTPRKSQKPVIKALRDWSKDGGGLYIHGPVGTGKTLLAARTAYRLWREPRPVIFIKAKRALDCMRDFDTPNPNGYGTMAARWLQVLQEAETLILDDLGAHRASEFAIEQMTAIFDVRRDFDKPTIVTSNLDPAKLKDVYDPRLAVRINQLCKPVLLK